MFQISLKFKKKKKYGLSDRIFNYEVTFKVVENKLNLILLPSVPRLCPYLAATSSSRSVKQLGFLLLLSSLVPVG